MGKTILISDLQGCLPALNKVMGLFDPRSVIVCGNITGVFPWPNQCIEQVCTMSSAVCGPVDLALIRNEHRGGVAVVDKCLRWNVDELNEKCSTLLKNLNDCISRGFTIDGNIGLVSHFSDGGIHFGIPGVKSPGQPFVFRGTHQLEKLAIGRHKMSDYMRCAVYPGTFAYRNDNIGWYLSVDAEAGYFDVCQMDLSAEIENALALKGWTQGHPIFG